MNAEFLFKRGLAAIREKRIPEGRRLLMQSLKLDPRNDEAWVWLARTEPATGDKRRHLERALKINPQNSQAQKLLARLPAPASAAALLKAKPVSARKKRQNEQRIAELLKKAEQFRENKQLEDAVE